MLTSQDLLEQIKKGEKIMEKENLAIHLLRTAKLCTTIMEGMLYLVEHDNHVILQQETALGLETVRKSFEKFTMEKKLIEDSVLLEKAVRTGTLKNDMNWDKGISYWYTSVLRFISEKIVLILESCPSCGNRGIVQSCVLLYRTDSQISSLYTEIMCTDCKKKWRI